MRILRFFVVPVAVFLLTLLGIWIFGGWVTNDFHATQAWMGVWVLSLGGGLFLVTRSRRELRIPAFASFALTATVSLGALSWMAGRNVEVRETLSAGERVLSAGPFAPVAHSGSGSVAIAELPDGSRRVVLSDLSTESGPDLFLVLTDGEPAPSANVLPAHLDLGPLKANRGTFEYVLPKDADVRRYSHAVVWCRLFSVPFTVAQLRPL